MSLPRGHRGSLLVTGVVAAALAAVTAVAISASGRLPGASSSSGAGAARPPRPAPEATPRVAPWLTYHGSAARTGAVDAGPAPGPLQRRWASPPLGSVYAEPLVDGDRAIVATEEDAVYALSLSDGHVLWRTQVGTAVQRKDPLCPSLDQVGITSTPVIDERSGTLYAVAFAEPGVHLLVALDVGSGRLLWSRSVEPGDGDSPLALGQRAALTLTGGRVLIPFGGRNSDCGQYHGWVVSAPLDATGPLIRFEVPTQQKGGGIWSPSGITVDADGSLLVATGNSPSGVYGPGPLDDSDSLLRLSPDLRVLDWFTPSDWVERNREDFDLGSVGPVVVDGGRVVQATKNGTVYLLQGASLGHTAAPPTLAGVCDVAFGATAYDASSHTLVVACTDGLVGVRVGDAGLSVAWRRAGYWALPPVIGSGGIAWSVDQDDGSLVGVRAADGGDVAAIAVGPVVHFTTPTLAGSMVLVATGAGLIAVGD